MAIIFGGFTLKSLSDISNTNKDIEKNKNFRNIQEALYLFEYETVSKSTSKLIPFKSLNSAGIGTIVRITPSSYRKYIESGYSIKIMEDFPSCIDIKEVDIENNSFIAKVINKSKNYILLSRYYAYANSRVNFEQRIQHNTMKKVRTGMEVVRKRGIL